MENDTNTTTETTENSGPGFWDLLLGLSLWFLLAFVIGFGFVIAIEVGEKIFQSNKNMSGRLHKWAMETAATALPKKEVVIDVKPEDKKSN